ncbi:MAG: hypothetical protein CMJ83_14975 [Planctomycetes bacterium]|nr:hypothetical protein [Planctomycetota bacterium]
MRFAILIVLAALLSGCTGLSREINQAMPEFLRSEPGEEEMAIFRKVRRTREWTEEDLQDQRDQVANIGRLRAEKEWPDAIARIEDFLEQFPVSKSDEKVRYWLGDAYYQDDDWDRAFANWRDFTALHPVSDYNVGLTERLYAMGSEFIDGERSTFFGLFSHRGTGVKIFNHLIETFPSTPRAADAQWKIGMYHLEEESWPDAELAFNFIVEQYDTSEWYKPALYYTAYCRYRQVKGIVYDPVMKKRAKEGFELYLSKAGDDARWREDATAIAAELNEQQAAQMLSVAEWLIDQDKPYSARYYLLSVMTRYPVSQAAARARELLPDTPGGEEGLAPEKPAADQGTAPKKEAPPKKETGK